jgi:hypothetical protein
MLLVSTSIGLYLSEGILTLRYINFVNTEEKLFQEVIKKSGIKYDTRTRIQAYDDLRKKDPETVLYVAPSSFRTKTDQAIMPMSSISKKQTVGGNENGYYAVDLTDRYGFNNPDREWDKEIIEFLLIGDSFTIGNTVNQPDTIAGNLRKFILKDKGALSLGHGGIGTLIEYAILREYLPLVNAKRVIWLYSELNDLTNLSDELKNKILLNYLNDENFTQNLYLKQNAIDNMINEYILNELEPYYRDMKDNHTSGGGLRRFANMKQINWLHFIKLYKVRKLTIEKFLRSPNKEFAKILKLSKEFTENNGASFYFVYIPEYNRYKNKLSIADDSQNYKKVIQIIKDLEIPFIDLNEELFQKHKVPLSLYPFRSYGHFNELGYKTISEIIFKKFYKN